jgi:transcriptional regulator with XRE-family HTH domain
MSNSVEQFSLVLRQLREERGWSQEQLAERANLNRSYLGEVERGHAVPSLITVYKLAGALEIRLSSFIARCEHILFSPSGLMAIAG